MEREVYAISWVLFIVQTDGPIHQIYIRNLSFSV